MQDENYTKQLIEQAKSYIKNADLPSAANLLTQAYNNFPFNKDIFTNLGNCYLGSGKQSSAIRCYLTYAHWIIANKKLNMNEFENAAYGGSYNWNGGNINESRRLDKDLHLVAVAKNFDLAKLVSEIDFISNVGLCYITNHQDIVIYNNIQRELIMNDMGILLDRQVAGLALRKSSLAGLVRTIGLAVLLRNLITEPELKNEEIISFYFSDSFEFEDI